MKLPVVYDEIAHPDNSLPDINRAILVPEDASLKSSDGREFSITSWKATVEKNSLVSITLTATVKLPDWDSIKTN